MTATALPLVSPAARVAGRTVLAAALTVWLLDGLFATSLCLAVSPGCTVMRTWQGVAGALIGRPATFQGGAMTFAFGLLLHFCVALEWSALYALLLARWDALARFTRRPANALLVGLVLGTVVWCVMDFLVMPLTRNPPTRFGTRAWWILLAGHLVVVGPPITLIVRRRE
jgi:uncharacterized membrane protein YagU involved in acid resistance